MEDKKLLLNNLTRINKISSCLKETLARGDFFYNNISAKLSLDDENEYLQFYYNNKLLYPKKIYTSKSEVGNNKVLFKFGVYDLNCFLNQISENQNVFIFLEDLTILNLILSRFNLKKLDNCNIFFIYDVKSFNMMTKKLYSYTKDEILNSKIISNLFIEKKFKSISLFKSNLTNFLNLFISDIYTKEYLVSYQIINIYKNVLFNSKIRTLKKYKYKNTAIVISAGYSLSHFDIEKLRQYQKNNIILIVVDTAYKYLIKNNIRPNIIVALDSQILNYYDFIYEESLKNTIILADISVNNKIVEKYKENIVFFTSLLEDSNENWAAPNLISHYISVNSNILRIPSFGNISLTSIVFASMFFTKIYTIGFDRGFNKYIYHNKHALDYEYYQKQSNYINNLKDNLVKFCLQKKVSNKKTSTSLVKDEYYFSKLKNKYSIEVLNMDEMDESEKFKKNEINDLSEEITITKDIEVKLKNIIKSNDYKNNLLNDISMEEKKKDLINKLKPFV